MDSRSGNLGLIWQEGNTVHLGRKNASGISRVTNRLCLQLVNSHPETSLTFTCSPAVALPDIDATEVCPEKSRLYFWFPVGTGRTDMLTPDNAKAVVCKAGPGWRIDRIEDRRYGVYWALTPDEEERVLDPGDSMSVYFDGLACEDELEALSWLNVRPRDIADTPPEPAPADLLAVPVRASLPTGPVGASLPTGPVGALLPVDCRLPIFKILAPPRAIAFTADMALAGIMDHITLSWEVAGPVSSLRIVPDVYDPQGRKVDAKGSLDVTMTESRNFMLIMKNGLLRHCAGCGIQVPDNPVPQLTADKTSIAYGSPVVLTLQLQGARHAYLNEGIGRVDFEAVWDKGELQIRKELSVTPTKKKTEYVLTCLGASGLVASTPVTVVITDRMEIVISYMRFWSGNTYRYQLNWRIDHADTIRLTPDGQREMSGNVPQDSASFDDKRGDVLLHVQCSGPGGQSVDYTRRPDI